MAVTKGSGNPDWTRDEVILALDLYFECRGDLPGKSDPRVIALSDLLKTLPRHSVAARRETFRNPDGVAFKLQNLRRVATKKGLGHVSQMDRAVWAELADSPKRTKEIAELIRAGIAEITSFEGVPDDEEFVEGGTVTQMHKRREREPRLRAKLIKQRRASGGLVCEICNCSAEGHAPELHDAIFEAHHLIPLSSGAERKTSLKDMALLCANCHRMLHRAIVTQKRWLSIEEARAAIKPGVDSPAPARAKVGRSR